MPIARNHSSISGPKMLPMNAVPLRWTRNRPTSVQTHSEDTGRRSSLARIASADLVQTNGLGLALCSARYALMAVCRSAIERKTPRRMRCRVILEKKFSTALSQEAEVGVKWKVQRGWRDSQASTLGCLWVA